MTAQSWAAVNGVGEITGSGEEKKKNKKEGRQASRKGWTSVLWSHRILGLRKHHVAKCRPFPSLFWHMRLYTCSHVCKCVSMCSWKPAMGTWCLLASVYSFTVVIDEHHYAQLFWLLGTWTQTLILCRRHFAGWAASQPHPFPFQSHHRLTIRTIRNYRKKKSVLISIRLNVYKIILPGCCNAFKCSLISVLLRMVCKQHLSPNHMGQIQWNWQQTLWHLITVRAALSWSVLGRIMWLSLLH